MVQFYTCSLYDLKPSWPSPRVEHDLIESRGQEDLRKTEQNKVRKLWTVEFLAAFYLVFTEEVDAGRNLFGSRYEDLVGLLSDFEMSMLKITVPVLDAFI